jgi:Domain of unknown function (DUF4249)
MKTFIGLAIIALSFFLYACEKVITIKPPAYLGKVSIQSTLEPDSLPVVYFNRTVPYFGKDVALGALAIRNAVVKITGNGNMDILHFDSVFSKTYCQYDYFYKGSKPVKLNQTYTLSIINGADTYTATAGTNLSKAIIDSTAYTPIFKDLYGEHEGVIVYFRDLPSQVNYYRYEMVRYIDTATQQAGPKLPASTCLDRTKKDSTLVHELGRSVYTDQGKPGQQVKIVIEPAYTHKEGTKGKIYIQTIDKNAYGFFDQLDKQKLAQYNPFVEPVFLREGQFGSRAIGYFSAMVKSNPVTYVFPE